MKKSLLALGATLTLSACVSDRVTLLSHSDGGPIGSVAVLQEGGDDTVLNVENQQARLSKRAPRVRQLTSVDPAYTELLSYLPPAASPLGLTGFPTGEMQLSEQQVAQIRAHLSGLESRPGYQVLIRGYTDSEGSEELNSEVSQQRAEGVAAIMRAAGYEIANEDVVGMGEYSARRANGDDVADANYRRVDVVIR
ncbi:OmpA family protein [Erythrobacter sp. Alg231-14]|uniref:OmpA family protein n=1 Tax=Erythrobacter sp. Alg231-14 TaxID=1922225 RepID=UPI000D54C24D